MQGMFSGATSFDQDINSWDVSNVETMALMFAGAESFDHPLDTWDVSNVTDMRRMFERATVFNSPIGGWDVSSVHSMEAMFMDARAFDQPIGAWDVSNVEDMSRMFYGFSDPTSFNQPIDAWDVGSVTDMSSMFFNAVAFNQPLDSWNVGNVTTMNATFGKTDRFDQDLSSWDVTRVEDMSYMFKRATSFDGDVGAWDVSGVRTMYGMFTDAVSFDRPIGNWDVSNVTDMGMTFNGAETFNQPLSEWDVSSVTDMATMFSDAVAFDQPIGTWDTRSVTSMRGMFNGASAFDQSLAGWDTGLVEDMSFLFYQAVSFDGDIGSWDTGSVTDMNQTFFQAVSFNQDIGTWDTRSVTHMGGMFSEAAAFDQPIGDWDTSSVTDMRMMFYRAGSFDQPVGTWDTGRVTDMSLMFYQAQRFDQPLGAWDTSAVESMAQMFQGAAAFDHDIGPWRTDSVTTMYAMFNAASAFDRDIGEWNTSNVYDMNHMFDGASSFNQDLSGWCVEQIPSQPASFDTGALAWSLPRPDWGTCPGATTGVEVTLAPRDVTVSIEESTNFTATVSGSGDTSLDWSATCGEVTGTTTEATYVTPAEAGTCVVTATSAANSSAWADATVTVSDPAIYKPDVVWSRQFGTGGQDEPRGAAMDVSTGHIFIVGSTQGSLASVGSGLEDAFVRAIDSEGAELWTRQLGSPLQDFAWDVAVAPDGTVIVAATLDGSGIVRKLGPEGTDVWTHTIPDRSVAYAVRVDSDGRVLVTGDTTGSLSGENAGERDIFVQQLDSDGDENWTRQFGGAGMDHGSGIAADADGNVAVVGTVEVSGSGSNAVVWKADADGNVLWERSIGSGDPTEGTAVTIDSDGAVLVAGVAIGSVGGPAPGDSDPFVRRYDADGLTEWTHQFGTTTLESLSGIAIDGSGRTAVVGHTDGALTEGSTGTRDAYLATVAADGTPNEIYQFGTTAPDLSHDVAVDASGALVVVGSTQGALGGSNLGDDDAFVTKLRP